MDEVQPVPAKKAAGLMKTAGTFMFLVASVILMIKRLPHHEYIAAIPDQPRLAAAGAASAPAPTASLPGPQTGTAPVTPAPAHRPAAAARVPDIAQTSELPPAAPSEAKDLTVECRSEIGILCFDVPVKRLAPCLREFDDALMKPCRSALRSLRPSRPRVAPEAPAWEP